MRWSPWFGSTLAAMLAMLPAHAAAPTNPAALKPLSDKDMAKITESGCEFAFTDAHDTSFVYAINSHLMIRTAAGVSICEPNRAQLDTFTEGSGSVSCTGRKLTLRRTGKVTGHGEADSATFPATLTVTQGNASATMRGSAGTAC